MVERLAPREGGIYVDAEALLNLALADELGQTLRAERELDDRLVGDDFRGSDLGAGHGCTVSCWVSRSGYIASTHDEIQYTPNTHRRAMERGGRYQAIP
jgi:hypothetical protein